MNPQFNSATGLPTLLDVISSSLSQQAGKLLVQAFDSKQISTGEISELLTPHARKGPAFTNALRTLTQVFREYGVNVTYSVIERAPKPAPRPKPTVSEKLEVFGTSLADKIIPLELEKKLPTIQPKEEEPVVRLRSAEVDEKVTTSFLADLSAQQSEFENKYHEEAILAMYFAEIGRYPLLTPDQEKEIGALSFDKKDLSARNKLMVHNLRLVIGVAKRYRFRGVGLSDLIQEGNIGLMKAAEKFNPHLGWRFSGYAMWWIRQAITRAIDNMGSIVRKPVHYLEKRREPYRKIMRLTKELGRVPTDDEIKKRTGYSGGLQGAIYLMRNMDSVSFEDPLNEGDPEGSKTFGDTFADVHDRPVDLVMDVRLKFEVVQKDLRELTKSVQCLPIAERNMDIFFRRYGLNSNARRLTLEGCASTLGITRERVRQIVNKVWEILEDNKVEYDDISLLETLKELTQLEMLTGEKADLIPRETDQSLLLDSTFPDQQVDLEQSMDSGYSHVSVNVRAETEALDKMMGEICKVFAIQLEAIMAPGRIAEVAYARQVAMYLLREDFKWPFVKIATYFGKEDHSTIIHGHLRIKNEVRWNSNLVDSIKRIQTAYAQANAEMITMEMLASPLPPEDEHDTVPETESVVPALSRDPVSVMVVNLVGKKTSVPPRLMLAEGRKERIVRARDIAIYLLREDFEKPAKEVAQLFGKFDGSVVWQSCIRIRDSLAEPEVAAVIEKIRAEYTLDIYSDVKGIGLNQKKLFPGQRAKGDEMLAERKQKVSQLIEALKASSAPERSKIMFSERFGLSEKLVPRKSLEEVGQLHDLTRQRVHQIINVVWERVIRPEIQIKDESGLNETLDQIEILDRLISAS
jgi:RNA polymerase sigma factor (sigma-70 family)